jgi:hypothetical protein
MCTFKNESASQTQQSSMTSWASQSARTHKHNGHQSSNKKILEPAFLRSMNLPFHVKVDIMPNAKIFQAFDPGAK